MADRVEVGTIVRVDLHGRRVAAWVTAVDVEPPPGVALRSITKVTGHGPSGEVISLAHWAAWRWAGRPQHLLTTASPENAVTVVPQRRATNKMLPAPLDRFADGAFDGNGSCVRLPPAVSPFDLCLAACRRGNALIVCASVGQARQLGARLRRAGVSICLYPRDWPLAAAGGSVIGARAAAFAPVVDLAAIVVVDEHDEAHQSERSPTWHARDVAIERANRAGVPVVLLSPTPSLEALDARPLVTVTRDEERSGWGIIEIADLGDEEPGRRSPISGPLMRALQSHAKVVCVLNTKGVARLLVCASCRTLARCERCDAAVAQTDDQLECGRCGHSRPVVCLECGASRMKLLRRGTSRLRDEIAAAVQEDVTEITGDAPADGAPTASRISIGTEAALHRIEAADVVAFLDIDAELFAPRFRAEEHVLALLARASRVVGGRPGRVLVQTSQPDHPVLQAAVLADPGRLVAPLRELRRELDLPPSSALAVLSGPGAPSFVAELRAQPVAIAPTADGEGFVVRAPDHESLATALSKPPRGSARLRIEVDPLRL